jgi:serine/threonine-protein kinase
MAMTGVAALVTLAFGSLLLRPEPPAPVARFSSPFEEGQDPGPGMEFTADGSALVYVRPAPSGGELQLWIRRWADLEAIPIRGTEGAASFALSPDGREVAFATIRGAVRIVGLVGGQPRALGDQAADTLGTGGGPIRLHSWTPAGMLYYGGIEGGIKRVPVTGGDPETLAADPYHLTDVLPDGRGFLVRVGSSTDGNRVALMGPDGGAARDLFAGAGARYARSGHLVYYAEAGMLMAVPFDLKRLEVTGSHVQLVDGVRSGFALSDNGTLLYRTGRLPGNAEVEFVWVTRSGEAAAVPGYSFTAPDRRPTLRLSPDGKQVAFSAVVADNADVWVLDLDDGEPTRLTFQNGFDEHPIWLDGERIAFVSDTAPGMFDAAGGDGPDFQVWALRTDGVGNAEQVVGGRFFARAATRDGRTLILYRGVLASESPGQRDIFTFRPGQDSQPLPLIASPEFQECCPTLSPDGRFVAYASNEAGRNEVFVRPFPDVGSARWQVSTDGGTAPVWAHNGAEIFYFQGGSNFGSPSSSPPQLMSAEVTTSGSTFRRGRVTPLFPVTLRAYVYNVLDHFYDVGPDDQRFLLTRTVRSVEEVGAVLVLNFFEELNRLVPK